MEEKINETENTAEAVATGKAKKDPEKTLEVWVAILLGVTALLTAWATWISSLHGGNQSTNYTKSNNLSAEGNADWNEAAQNMMQDMMTWNTLSDLLVDISYAEENGDEETLDKLNFKFDKTLNDNCSEEFIEAINWAIDQEEWASPFDYVYDDGTTYEDSYFTEARELIKESDELLEQGKKDNSNGDKYNLVTVIYSLALFLLGIVGVFKNLPNKRVILIIACIAIVLATVYMCTIPLPTGFSLGSFIGK